MINPSRVACRRVCLAAGLLLLLPTWTNAATLSAPVARQVQKAIDLQSKQQLSEAAALLRATRTPTRYDRAYVERMLGTLYWQQGKALEGINALSSAVDSGALEGAELRSTQRMLADILLTQHRYQDALTHYYGVVGAAKGLSTPDPSVDEIWLRIAQAHYQNKEMEQSLSAIKRHLKTTAATSAALTIKLGAELSLKRWRDATETLKALIAKEPENKTWWVQLVASYQHLDAFSDMLNTLVLAERSGLTLSADEKMLQAQLYVKQGVPEKGAAVLRQLNETSATEQRLAAEASYWQQAKEWDNAIAAWERAAMIESKYFWIGAQLALQQRQYQKGLDLLEKVDDKAPKDRVALAKALAYDKLDKPALALQHAELAQSLFPSPDAASWVEYLRQKLAKQPKSMP